MALKLADSPERRRRLLCGGRTRRFVVVLALVVVLESGRVEYWSIGVLSLSTGIPTVGLVNSPYYVDNFLG
jgi:hypothetical protein